MVSKDIVKKRLKELNFSMSGWGKREIEELPNILLPEEEIYELVNGIYEGGFALLVSTDVRVLLIDKKPMNYLTIEDLRFDMISEIDYSNRFFGAEINISTGNKNLNFRSYNQARLRKVINHVQHCMAELKRRQSARQQGQNEHLERINEQLKAYLQAQSEYQHELHRIQQAQQKGEMMEKLPIAPRPSPELSDYLFARSLLNHYENRQKMNPGFLEKIAAVGRPVVNEAPLMSKRELHDLWSAGMQEVFGKRIHSKNTVTYFNSFDIHPASIIFSRLSQLVRSRRLDMSSSIPLA